MNMNGATGLKHWAVNNSPYSIATATAMNTLEPHEPESELPLLPVKEGPASGYAAHVIQYAAGPKDCPRRKTWYTLAWLDDECRALNDEVLYLM